MQSLERHKWLCDLQKKKEMEFTTSLLPITKAQKVEADTTEKNE